MTRNAGDILGKQKANAETTRPALRKLRQLAFDLREILTLETISTNLAVCCTKPGKSKSPGIFDQ